MSLDLYAKIEPHLEFEQAISSLYYAFLETIDSLEKKETVIDIGCGQGEFMRLLHNKGHDTFGIDLSTTQVNAAKKKGLNAQAIDIKNINSQYSIATAVFDVLNYIPPHGLEEFLRQVANALFPQGHFIFDINSLCGFEEIAPGCLVIDKTDLFIAIDAVYEQKELHTSLSLFTQSHQNCFKKEQSTITQYYHSVDTIVHCAQKAGFEVIKIEDLCLHSEYEADKFIVTLVKT